MTTSKIAMPIVDTAKSTSGKRASGNSDYSSFDTIMNKNVQAGKEDVGKKVNTVKKDNSFSKTDNDKGSAVADKQHVSSDKASDTNQVVSEKERAEVSSQEVKNSTEEQETVISDEVKAALSQLEQMILTNVSEQLGKSSEELSSQLEGMEMSPLDLLDTDNLKQFVLNLNGAESPVEFLTNEAMTEQFQNLSETVEQIPVEDLGITKEQVSQMVQLMTDEKAKPLMEQNMANASTVLQTEQQNESENMEVDLQSAENDSEEEIPITVTKETANNENKLSDQRGKAMQQGGRNQREDRTMADRNEKPMDLFIQNLSARHVSNLDNISQTLDRSQMMKDIVHQIVEQIKVSIKPDSTSMEMQLNPEHLGKINLTVVEKNGEMTANIVAQNHAAKEAIESQIQTLKDSLNNQGLKVEAVEVTVSEFGFRQDAQTGQGTENQEKNKNSNSNRRKIDLSTFDENEEDVTEEDKLAAKVMRDNGGSIDYTA